jgi:hypothetical protein
MPSTACRWWWIACCAWLAACGSRGGNPDTNGLRGTGPQEAARDAATTPETPDDTGPADAAPAAPEVTPCRPVPTPPPTQTTDVNWDHDDSTACPEDAGFVHLILPDGAGPDLESCAAVNAIRPAPDPAGYGRDPYATVVLEGSGAEESRSFLLRLPAGAGSPFAVGDLLSVRIHERQEEIHRVVQATIADAEGRLLLALAGDGDPAWAPGWRLKELEVGTREPAQNPGGAERREHVVGLSTGGRVARVPPEACRQLEVDGAAWWVTAEAVRYGEGTRLPDSSEYLQYALVRATLPRP